MIDEGIQRSQSRAPKELVLIRNAQSCHLSKSGFSATVTSPASIKSTSETMQAVSNVGRIAPTTVSSCCCSSKATAGPRINAKTSNLDNYGLVVNEGIARTQSRKPGRMYSSTKTAQSKEHKHTLGSGRLHTAAMSPVVPVLMYCIGIFVLYWKIYC